jgi:hydrogenase/urease accessory protein HupE
MAEAVYLLCALTSLWCAVALLRSYLRRGTRLLLWSSLCFVGLAANNAILFVDLVLLPRVDLSLVRALIGATAILVLVIGLVWDTE